MVRLFDTTFLTGTFALAAMIGLKWLFAVAMAALARPAWL